jgi:hypothetical protein
MKLSQQQKLVKRIVRYMHEINRLEPYGWNGDKCFYNGYPAPAPFAKDYHRKTKHRKRR